MKTLAMFVTLSLFAAVASAADVVDVSIDSGPILNVGAVGSAKNNITINQTFSPPKLIVIEQGSQATIVAGPGCVKLAGINRAECNSTGVTTARVFLWGGDDTLVNNTRLKTTTYAGGGNDTIHSGAGDDVVYGEEGIDTIVDDGCLVDNSGFDNFLYGGSENDTIRGAISNVCRDYIEGQGGTNDKLYGRGGNDRIVSRDTFGGDLVDCGGGQDEVQVDAGDSVAGDCEIRLP